MFTIIGYEANGNVGGDSFYSLSVNGNIVEYYNDLQALTEAIITVKALFNHEYVFPRMT